MSNYPFRPREFYVSDRLKAKGNLTYLQFIRLLEKLWSDGHPDIPLYAMGNDIYPKYPCMVYGLQLRKTMTDEPKMRYREQVPVPQGEPGIIIQGQRFENIVLFTAIDETNPLIAEELIEAFEDFMLEYTPIFKAMGLSEIRYSRRLPDSDENRSGQSIVKRTVSYSVTTEKIVVTREEVIESILIDARLWWENLESTSE